MIYEILTNGTVVGSTDCPQAALVCWQQAWVKSVKSTKAGDPPVTTVLVDKNANETTTITVQVEKIEEHDKSQLN